MQHSPLLRTHNGPLARLVTVEGTHLSRGHLISLRFDNGAMSFGAAAGLSS